MNLVESVPYTNMYIRAADVREKLHKMFVNNEYGFAILLMKYIKEKNFSQFKLMNIVPDQVVAGEYEGMYEELEFNYSLSDNGLSPRVLDIQNIHAVMYVDILQKLSSVVIDVIEYLYQMYYTGGRYDDDNLGSVYDFIQEVKINTRSAITMLFDIQIYMEHFIFRI